MRGDQSRCEQIRGDTGRCGEMRGRCTHLDHGNIRLGISIILGVHLLLDGGGGDHGCEGGDARVDEARWAGLGLLWSSSCTIGGPTRARAQESILIRPSRLRAVILGQLGGLRGERGGGLLRGSLRDDWSILRECDTNRGRRRSSC